MYPEKIFHSILEEPVKMFVPYSGECEYRLDYRNIDKNKPWGVATFYLDPLIRNHKEIKKMEKDGYMFHKHDKVTLVTYNSIKTFNLIFYKNHIPKPLFITKILQLIDKNFDKFKRLCCEFNFVKQPCNCENNNSVTRNLCSKLYS